MILSDDEVRVIRLLLSQDNKKISLREIIMFSELNGLFLRELDTDQAYHKRYNFAEKCIDLGIGGDE